MYGSIELIKNRLKVTSTVTTYDSDMTLALNQSSRWIDNKLSFYSTIIPSTIATLTLGDIAADYGAALFRSYQIPNTIRLVDNVLDAATLFKMAKDNLDDYIKYNYLKGTISASTIADITWEIY
jgi:hypothetical protein